MNSLWSRLNILSAGSPKQSCRSVQNTIPQPTNACENAPHLAEASMNPERYAVQYLYYSCASEYCILVTQHIANMTVYLHVYYLRFDDCIYGILGWTRNVAEFNFVDSTPTTRL